MNTDALFSRAADLIRRAHHLVVLTGAGISTPSGIPDFRSLKSGLWSKANPFAVASLKHKTLTVRGWVYYQRRELRMNLRHPASIEKIADTE